MRGIILASLIGSLIWIGAWAAFAQNIVDRPAYPSVVDEGLWGLDEDLVAEEAWVEVLCEQRTTDDYRELRCPEVEEGPLEIYIVGDTQCLVDRIDWQCLVYDHCAEPFLPFYKDGNRCISGPDARAIHDELVASEDPDYAAALDWRMEQNLGHWRRAVDLILAEDPDLVLHVGDHVNTGNKPCSQLSGGMKRRAEEQFELLREHGLDELLAWGKYVPAQGNHDLCPWADDLQEAARSPWRGGQALGLMWAENAPPVAEHSALASHSLVSSTCGANSTCAGRTICASGHLTTSDAWCAASHVGTAYVYANWQNKFQGGQARMVRARIHDDGALDAEVVEP